MNTDTGQIYRGEQEITEARGRGESIVDVSERVAALLERGQLEMDKDQLRAEWRKRWFGTQKAEGS